MLCGSIRFVGFALQKNELKKTIDKMSVSEYTENEGITSIQKL